MPNNTATLIQIKGFPLIKFQSSERIESLREGKMYLKSLEYYRKLEAATGNNVVGDLFEGVLHINEAKLIIPDLGEEIEIKDGLIPTSCSNDFVFCMFGINPALNYYEFSDEQKDEMSSFGDTALLITDKDEFLRRVISAAKKAGATGFYGFVKYYDQHVDSVNLLASLLNGMENIAFWKRDQYRYQQEFRFLIHMESAIDDHIELDIGDITDISRVLKSSVALNAMAMQHTVENP